MISEHLAHSTRLDKWLHPRTYCVIIYPCHNLRGSVVNSQLKFGIDEKLHPTENNENNGRDYFTKFKLIHVNKRGLWYDFAGRILLGIFIQMLLGGGGDLIITLHPLQHIGCPLDYSEFN